MFKQRSVVFSESGGAEPGSSVRRPMGRAGTATGGLGGPNDRSNPQPSSSSSGSALDGKSLAYGRPEAMAAAAAAAESAAVGGVGVDDPPMTAEMESLTPAQVRELEEKLRALGEEIVFLKDENTFFESYYTRFHPSQADPMMSSGDESAADGGAGGRSRHASRSRGSRGASRRSRQADKRTEDVIVLSFEEKFEVLSREIDEMKYQKERERKEYEKLIEQVRTEMEEADTEIAEVKKDLYEFRRDVVGATEAERRGLISGERITKYFDDKLKEMDAQIEKMRLKNASLKGQIAKLNSQLQQREEMGEVLHAIDFDQLKIENQQYIEAIEEKNEELLKLKLTAGRSVQMLNTLKTKLNSLTTNNSWIRNEAQVKQNQLERVKDEIDQVMTEKEHTQRVNRKLVNLQEEVKVPEILDYVTQKAVMYDLEKQEKDWIRKLEISTKMLQTARSKALAESSGGVDMQ